MDFNKLFGEMLDLTLNQVFENARAKPVEKEEPIDVTFEEIEEVPNEAEITAGTTD